MARRACVQCGRTFEAQTARYCGSTCRKNASRAGTTGASVTVLSGDAPARLTLHEATRLQLEDADRLADPSGVAALVLAEQIDRGGQTGSQAAALVKEHRAALAEALRGAAQRADRVDELRARRAARLAQA